MKKLPKLILPTLILGAVTSQALAPKTSALYIDDDGATWYTVQELLGYKEEVDRETDNLCGDDMGCRENLYYSHFEAEDYKFWALEQLLDQQVVLTAVNPKEETLKVLYFDEDMMLKRMGVSEPIDLEVFYLGWFEYGTERIYNFGGITDELSNETMPGTHKIYYWDTSVDGPNPIPANQEFELSAAGSGLNSNVLGEIPYGADAGMYKFNAVGRFIYTSCLAESDYEEGKECRLMISGEKGQAYFPPRETIIENEQNNGDDPDQTGDITPDSGQTEVIDKNIEESNSDQTENNTKNSFADQTFITDNNQATRVTQAPKAPNTGVGNICIEDYDFPWWLVVALILIDVAILWTFWPKKSKKPIDKK